VQDHLAQALRTRTRQLHTEVERSGVMHALLRGRIDRPSYCLLLRNLHDIYRALEGALERHASLPTIAPILLPGLARRETLAEDLLSLHGAAWKTDLPVLPAAQGYVARLAAAEREAPGHLLAHAYVRYLGDLSGGQILRRIVAQSLGLEGAEGTRFYTFGEPDQAPGLAQRFRAGLDAIKVDGAAINALVVEAQWGFAQHGRLFRQVLPLAERAPPTSSLPLAGEG